MADARDRFEVQNPEITAKLREIGQIIGPEMPQGWGFAFFMFEFGDAGSMFYISSGERESVMAALKEFLDKKGGKQ